MKLSHDILDKLAREYGDAFYLLDTSKFRSNYRELLAAFRAYYPKTSISYSYKTNYTPQLCQIIQEEGGFAEVVSEMEYELAKRLSVDSINIYYNGPYKKTEILEKVLLEGAHINVDSVEEAHRIIKIAKEHPDRQFRIGIRCNFDIGNGIVSRFGIDTDAEEFVQICAQLNACSNIRIVGLHCHFPDRVLQTYEKRVQGMIELIQEKVTWKLDYVSMGGGYFSRMPEKFAKEFAFPVATFEDYAKVIGEGFSKAYTDYDEDEKPMLLLEPGSALVADTMVYVTRVVSLKHIRKRDIAVLTGSLYNINPNAKGVNRPIEIYSDTDDTREYETGNWDLVGYTCIENDVMYHGLRESLKVGDYIVFENIGSYSIVFKPPFILPNVPVIEWDSEAEGHAVIKRAETVEDVFHTFEWGLWQ